MKINGAWNKITRSLSVSYQVKLFAFNIATSCITEEIDHSISISVNSGKSIGLIFLGTIII